MKTIITGFILLINFSVIAQDREAFLENPDKTTHNVYLEITDTIETAYHTYFDGWEQDGFSIEWKVKKDSIGVDRVIIKRIYYLEKCDPYKDIRDAADTLLPYYYKKKYLDYEEREYPNGNSSYYDDYYGF